MYEVWCRTISSTPYASIHSCSIFKDEKEVRTVQLRVLDKKKRPYVRVEDRDLREIWDKTYSKMDLTLLLKGRLTKIDRNLEFLIKNLIDKGYWIP
jgi:hypothetical protein